MNQAVAQTPAVVINGELVLTGVVGDPTDGFTAIGVRRALAGREGPLTVRLNSGGGLAFEGIAIFNALREYPGRVTIKVDGIAASAASLIFMAGEQREVLAGAMIMIHDPSAVTIGPAEAHRKSADVLDSLGEQFARIYSERASATAADIRRLMLAETWFDGEQAVAQGLATDTNQIRASSASTFAYQLYRNPPAALGAFTAELPISLLIDKERPMTITANAPTVTAPTAAEIRARCDLAKLPPEATANIINQEPGTFDSLSTMVLDALCDRQGPEIQSHVVSTPRGGGLIGDAIADALYSRMSGKPPTIGREFAAASLLEMGQHFLAARGERVSFSSKDRLVERLMARAPHTRDDFPSLLQGAGQRVLLDGYQAAESPLKRLARLRTAADFRALTVLRLSEAPRLEEVGESAEITHGSRGELKESYSVKTFAKLFGLSRQAIINDDLGAFSDMNRAWGRAAAETEADQLVALLLANSGNGVMMDDGKTLYHTSRGNKAAAAGLTSLLADEARTAMRKIKSMDGKTPLSIAPRFAVVGPELEGVAKQIWGSPTELGQPNPAVSSKVDGIGAAGVLVEPRLPGIAWRLFADPAVHPVIEVAYLNGVQGPRLDTREGWDVLGTEFRAVLDFGCGVIDWRGTYLSPDA